MSEERKTKTDAAAPASAALERIDRKDAFLQALHTFLTAHQGTEWAVAAVDIQHFKLYNELYGTEKGDVLLETMANCLLGYSKQTGYPVGYFGNDDFFLCLPDEKAEQTAVLATLQACMAAGRQDVTFFVVMGVCPVQANPGADAATLCNYAQIAGVTTDSGYLHRFEPTMLNELKEQQQLLGELERTGLVTRLDQYIWESVCQTLQKWQESGSNLVPVSVNVSVQDILNLDVPQIFADLVEKYKLEPKLLLAEITETMVAEDTQMVENAIQGLHRKGFSVMMDDFGSGYSSLNMLKDTNVDAIKLDMKLIDMNQENRSKGVQIVESVVDMAHRLNLPIIAEGVETPEQVSMLQAADCLYSQGYYFFKPMPVENAEKLLADPTNQDYWDLRRDLMRRDRRVENPGTEKTALALQAYQIFTDNVLEISLLNLATGAYRVIKRDARLLGADLEKEEDFVNYCDRLVNEKIVHEEDADLFLEQTDLEALRSVLYHATAPEFYRYRENVSGQYIWVTTEVLPCRGCCAQNPWATVLVRNDAQADQLSEELDFSYSHDTLTGLANRSRYETDLRELPHSGYESVVCTYIDVVGMHEVNEHLGHRSGDTLLCCLANAARKFFATSRVYRIGSDEFVILTPNEPPYSVWSTADRMRAFLKEKDYAISVGIQQTTDLRHVDEAVAKAEAAMRQDRQTYYEHNGRARQLEGLNEKMERTLQEKRDAEHFLKVLAPKYKTVIVVDLQEDTVRPVIVPDDFQSVLDTCGGSFRAALTNYRDTLVAPEDRENFAKLFDFGLVRSTVFSSNLLEHRYRKTDGRSFCIRVTPYSRSGSHINEVLWIFADEDVE